MRGLHNLQIGAESHYPGRKVDRGELALGVPWRHVDDETLDVAVGNAVEFFSEQLMVFTLDELGPDVFDVFEEGVPHVFLGVQVLQAFLQQQDFLHFIFGEVS